MSQRGGIALILLILVLVAAMAIGAYFISQNTGFFSNAGSAQITIPYKSSSPKPSVKASPATVLSPEEASSAYENPFDNSSNYENPFDDAYENPFNQL